MSQWLQWSGHPLVLRLGGTLLHFLWQGAVIAGLFAAAQTALRRRSSNWRYASGCLALALMLAAPLLTFLVLGANPIIPITPTPVAGELAKTRVVPTSSSAEGSGSAKNPAHNPNPNPPSANLSAKDLATAEASAKADNPPILHILTSEKFLPAFVLSWLLGVFALSLRLLFGSLQVARWKRQGHEPLGTPWLERLHRLQAALQISRPVLLVKSVFVQVPTVVGWLRPVILLPAASLTGLTPDQLETILAHELAHIRRHDYLVNVLQNALETLLFYHPAVWWISHCVRAEREICCDEIAIQLCGERLVYARALATLEELRDGGSALALGADGGSLLERIRRLTGAPTDGGLPGQRRAAGGAFVAALVALIFISLLHHPSSSAKAQSVGSTGNLPVPSGDSPDGTRVQRQPIPITLSSNGVPLLPVGESPTGAGGSPAPPANPPGLSLVIRCTNEVLKVGDEIPIQFIISNHGPGAYGYRQGPDDFHPDEFEWIVKASSGEILPAPHPRITSLALIHRGDNQGVIIPGESFTNVIVLNRWVPLNAPGQYVVTATYHPDDDLWRFPTNREPIIAAPINITVLPRTTEEMHDYVKNLTNQISVEIARQYLDPALVWRLICTGSPEMVPTLFATMTLPDPGYAREALLYHVPRSDEIQDAITNAIAEEATRNKATWNLYELLADYGDEHGHLRPFIEWALAPENNTHWMGGSLLARNSAFGDVFTARLAAIAVATNAPPWANSAAMEALAFHRTEAGLKVLTSNLNNPDPNVSSETAGALANAFHQQSPSPNSNPIRPEDFDATEMRTFIQKKLAAPEAALSALPLMEFFPNDALTPQVALWAINGRINTNGPLYGWEVYANIRWSAILILAMNRTDEGVAALKTLLQNPDPKISNMAEQAIKAAYTAHGNIPGKPLRPDDFDAKFQQPVPTPVMDSRPSEPSTPTNTAPSNPPAPPRPSSNTSVNEPSGISGTVVFPNGQPAAGAELVLQRTDDLLQLDVVKGLLTENGATNLPEHGAFSQSAFTVADANGHFHLPPMENAVALLAIHPQGFTWMSSGQWKDGLVLRLEPLGRIEGTFRFGTRPGTNEEIYLNANEPRLHLFSALLQANTDSTGRFAFTNLPAIRFNLIHRFRLDPPERRLVAFLPSGGRMTFQISGAFCEREKALVKAGETTEADLGGTGRAIVGQLKKTGVAFDWNHARLSLQSSPGPEVHGYCAKIAEDGGFRFENVGAGDYDLAISVYSDDAGSNVYYLNGPSLVIRHIVVPEMAGGRSLDALDLGALEMLHPKAENKIKEGGQAPAIPATSYGSDFSGGPINAANDPGKYILLDLCGNYYDSDLPFLQATRDAFATDNRLVIKTVTLGYVLKDQAVTTMYTGPIQTTDWADAYGLLDQNRVVRQIVLIGPDGKIIAKNLHGNAIQAAVAKALGLPVGNAGHRMTEAEVMALAKKSLPPNEIYHVSFNAGMWEVWSEPPGKQVWAWTVVHIRDADGQVTLENRF